jgi:hypothetical protein
MNTTDLRRYIVEAALPLTALDESTPIPGKRGLELGISGVLQYDGADLKVLAAVEKDFPASKPGFFLLNGKELPRIPHVDDDGYICYTHEDSIVMDIQNPAGIIRECFDLAMQTVRDGLSGKNTDHFLNEYEAYWRRSSGVQVLYANIRVTDTVQAIKYSRQKESKAFFAAGDETDLLNSYSRYFDAKANPVSYRNGIYIPLIAGPNFYIPAAGQDIDIEQVRKFVTEFVPGDQHAALVKMLEKTKTDDLVIFGLHGPNGLYSLFGVYLKNIQHRRHPLLPSGATTMLIPLTVQRLDASYLLARGGTGLQFLDKKLLVIGAGSVGSAICDELVKAAIVNLTVVDKETLEIENGYRHDCGIYYTDYPKAIAVQMKLQDFYPHAIIRAVPAPVLDAINNGTITLRGYDAIIVATGNATLNQQLIRIFQKEIKGTPVLFAWLDPLGLGGHCLVSNLPGKGCYQCLYSNDELHNIASFAHYSQDKDFNKSLTGCGSAFVPYGSLDAGQTAILTVRKTIQALRGQIPANELVSWKGSAELFLQEGYRLAERYKLNAEELDNSKCLFYQPSCQICGNN